MAENLVYFGPWEHSPVEELPEADRKRWLNDFAGLAELDQHFWTNNPFMLDAFSRERVQVWDGEQWQSLAVVAVGILDPDAKAETAGLPNGKLALTAEMLRAIRDARANKVP